MIRPLRGYVLVQLIEDDNKTESGLIVPDSAKEKPMKGKVIEVGGKNTSMVEMHYSPEVEKDDIVYFKRWGGDAIKIEGKDYQFVKFEELLGVEE